jgi:hypothetical protein
MVRSILKQRVLLVLGVGAIVAVMLFSSISMSSAQPSGGPTCSDGWFRDWQVWESEADGVWLYFWWYQFCKDPYQGDGWFKAYHSWEWGEALG